MSHSLLQSDLPAAEPVVIDGEMARLVREMDWAETPLGPMDSWSASLRMMVPFLLANRFPLLLWWGPEFVSIYNDAYRPVLGSKHPWALGKPVSDCWQEIWHILRPLIETPFRGGPATWMEDLVLEIRRHGYLEETHFTVAYSPVPDEAAPTGIGGVLATVHETTSKIIGERRLAVLRETGARSLEARTAREACVAAAAALEAYGKDVPFALFYLLEGQRPEVRLVGSMGARPGDAVSPVTIDLGQINPPWPFAEVAARETMMTVEDLNGKFAAIPPGPWPDPPNRAIIAPIKSTAPRQVAGFLVVGVSSRLRFDDAYAGFIELLAAQVSTAVANASADEEERRRADALAEIDRAKTDFFSNVSHEFRTPLTLMLGPLGEILMKSDDTSLSAVREPLTMAHRNSLRLQKLVDTLLDFSRLEAGRLDAVYEEVDLAALTAELAGVFRSAIEKAGLRFRVDCVSDGSAFVDRDLWEKIVFNLLSNALKFTVVGEIALRLVRGKSGWELEVRDTGIGIPERELPNLFKRFHRIANTRSRTHEGTGIGLALISELAKLHGGGVSVSSVVEQGSVFTVWIPTGRDHLPSEFIGDRARRAGPDATRPASSFNRTKGENFVAEALRWIPATTGSVDFPMPLPEDGPDAASVARVVIADDNADMRDYLARLLGGSFAVEAFPNGEAALDAIRRHPPDLVLTDVMMPKLDGFGLLRAIRADPALGALPVIILSARAGEESSAEGLGAGADDYIVKPFAARELHARVGAHLQMARMRGDLATQRQRMQAIEAQRTQELETQVAARTQSLSEAVAQMEEFSYSVSHDLRAPVRAMRGYAEAILADHGRELHRNVREMLERIQSNGQRMDRLIQDLLTYSRVSQREMTLEPVPLDRLVREIIQQYPEFDTVQADIEVPSALPVVVAHEPSLTQVVSNLLSNAVKFSRPGRRPRVRIRYERKDLTFVRVILEDDGIGVPTQYQPRLFQMFERVHLGTGFEGTGIGLAIVRKAVERMNGRVGVESDGSQGSRFWFELPAGD